MKRKCIEMWCVAAIGLAWTGAVLVHAAPDPTFTYQGELKNNGEPYNGQIDLRFELFAVETGGTPLETVYVPEVYVVDGLFTAELNFGTEFFNGESRWLQISVPGVSDQGDDWVPLEPRQPIRPAPYAIFAYDAAGGGTCLWQQNGSDIYYNDGDVGVGTSTPDYPLHVTSTGGVTAVAGENPGESTSGYLGHEYGGVYGEGYYAVYGLSSSTSGRGVYGEAAATSGTTYGVYGRSVSTDGIAVYGWASNSSGTGTTIGVKGEIDNPSGAALYGEATATTGTANGLFAQTASTEGSGVFGQNTSASGDNEGVMGVSWSSFGKGVMGYAGSTASTAIGVLGRTSTGNGVRGEATAATGAGIGVYGDTDSASGHGVYGYAPSGGHGVTGYSGDDDYGYLGWSGGGVYGYSGDGYGVRGYSQNDWGVLGVIPNDSTQAGVVGAIKLSNGAMQWVPNSGVCGSSEDGYGVSGRVDGGVAVYGVQDDSGNIGHLGTSTEGVYGETDNTNSHGVHGKSTASNSYASGVYGETSGATYGFGVRGQANNSAGAAVYGSNIGGGSGGHFYSSGGNAGKFQNTGDDCVYIDHDDNNSHFTAALKIESTGTNEPIGMDVHVDAEWGSLAWFHLDNATEYYGDAFIVSADNLGMVGDFQATNSANASPALRGKTYGTGTGVAGSSSGGVGVYGISTDSTAGRFAIVNLNNPSDALEAATDGTGNAIYGYSSRASSDAPAILGEHAEGDYGIGVKGIGGYRGLEGRAEVPDGSLSRYGVYARATGGTATNYGVYGYASGGSTNWAGYFNGNVNVTGTVSKGGGSFQIDHPLDPENKYLYHSFVESPDMMNIYNGNVVLDSNGEAVVTMPEWFEALNRHFRYQLTAIGAPGPNLYIAEEIADNQFKIAGGKPGLKVSWQVTGIRQDPFAEANRIPVEVDKPASERGTYLHPDAYGLPEELQVDRVREAAEERARAIEMTDEELGTD